VDKLRNNGLTTVALSRIYSYLHSFPSRAAASYSFVSELVVVVGLLEYLFAQKLKEKAMDLKGFMS
jgi:hypothetical protein